MQKTNKDKILSALKMAGATLGVTLLLLIAFLYAGMQMIIRGPSGSAKELFVLSLKETSVGGILVNICMTPSEIEQMLSVKQNAADMELLNGETTDPSKIVINKDNQSQNKDESGKPKDPKEGISTVEIKTDTYKGMLMIIEDPTRVFVGVPDAYGENEVGLSLRQMIDKYDAIGGVNGGGFYDPDGTQKGGIPKGSVIKDGKILWGDNDKKYSICGFDKDGILHVGSMTAREALNKGVIDSVSFGPALIINENPVNADYYLGVSRNPRTAIGQRADGAILLLVIEGRSMSSFGATFDDLIEVFLKHGAVNATNLDGGYSSLMVYDGGDLTMNSYAYGERILPNCILVR